MMDAPDVVYLLWQTDGNHVSISHEDAPLVDRAMKLWADSRRDTWISVTGPTGVEYGVLASTLNATTCSTAQQRYASTMREKTLADEHAEHRRLAGYIESE